MDNNNSNNILNSLTRGLSQSMFPGHRVPRVSGFEGIQKFSMPLDCEVIALDKNPESNHLYMKYVDQNGDEVCERYRYEKDPVPKFEPGKYVTNKDFNAFKEDVLNAINSLKQPAGQSSTEHTSRSSGNGKQLSRTDNGIKQSDSDV